MPQNQPTQEQVLNAFAVIESASPDDVMALTVTAISFANRHDKLDEVAANLEADLEGDYVATQNAFNPFNE
jgi:hypothetical protein